MKTQSMDRRRAHICLMLAIALAFAVSGLALADDGAPVADPVEPLLENELIPEEPTFSEEPSVDPQASADAATVGTNPAETSSQGDPAPSPDEWSSPESAQVDPPQLGAPATQGLTGWYTPDGGATYYWYDNGTRRTTAGWKVTGLVPSGGSGGLQRYWLGADGALARDRLIDPAEGHGAWWAYATSSGTVVRGRQRVGSNVYLANNDGRLAGPGWVVSSAYGQGLQRYYVDPSAHACVVGYSASGWPHYTTEQGYVLRGRQRVGSNVYLANNDGRLAGPGWVVSSAYGQGLQRYYVDPSAHACVVGYSASGWPHYTTEQGYVLRGRLKVGSSIYLASNDGRLAGPGWVVSSAYGQGLQRYYVDPSAHACLVGYSIAGWPHYTTEQGYVLRGRLKVGKITYFADNNGRIISTTGGGIYQTSTGRRTYPNHANWYGKPNPFSAPSLSEVARLYPAFSAFSNAGAYDIPGLVLTNLGMDYCDVMIPQGICATKNYLIISAHCSGDLLVSTIADGKLATQGGNATLLASLRKNQLHALGTTHTHDSVLYVIDRQSGTYLKTIELTGLPEAAKHMGGITTDGTSLWLVTSSSLSGDGLVREARLPLSVIDKALSSPDDCVAVTLGQLEFVPLRGTDSAMHEASFNVWYGGRLWVGDFYTSKLACLKPGTSNGKSTLTAERIYDIPPETQGAMFVESGGRKYLLLNASYGRRNTSRAYLYDITGGIGSLARSAARTMWLPPMLEEGCVWDGRVYQLFESGSTFYSTVDSDNQGMRTSLIVDQICIGSVSSVLSASTAQPKLTGAAYLTQVILSSSLDVQVYNDAGTLVCVVEDGMVDPDSLGVSVDARVEDGQTVLELSDDVSYSLRLTRGNGQDPSRFGAGEEPDGGDVVVQACDEQGSVTSSQTLSDLVFDEAGACELHIGASMGATELADRLDGWQS